MAEVVLVHGTCHGAWCWRHVVPLLEAQGHRVTAIDMPGHGADQTPISQATLKGCVDAILTAITDKAILVGHSWGGVPISAAAGAAPDKVARLVYLSAYIGEDGQSLMDQRARAGKMPISEAVQLAPDRQSYKIAPDRVADLFYHDCAPEDVAFAQANLCPQAIAPQSTKLTLGERFNALPKSYIRCRQDRTIPIAVQIALSDHLPKDDIYELDSSHSPFFSDPEGLVSVLGSILRS